MTYLDANKYLLWAGDGAGPEVFAAPAGQVGIEWTRSSAKVDQTVKTSTYEVGRPGVKSISLSLDLKVSLPDANGYTRLETAHKAGTAINIQIRKDGATGADDDKVFAASVYVADIQLSGPQGGDVTAKISFMLAADPTTDTLA